MHFNDFMPCIKLHYALSIRCWKDFLVKLLLIQVLPQNDLISWIEQKRKVKLAQNFTGETR